MRCVLDEHVDERQCCGTNSVVPSYVIDAVGLPIVERNSIVEISAALPHTSADAAASKNSFIVKAKEAGSLFAQKCGLRVGLLVLASYRKPKL